MEQLRKKEGMTYEEFRVKRQQIAYQIYECLKANKPKDVVDVHRPDDIGAVGLDYGPKGYILIQVEDAQ